MASEIIQNVAVQSAHFVRPVVPPAAQRPPEAQSSQVVQLEASRKAAEASTNGDSRAAQRIEERAEGAERNDERDPDEDTGRDGNKRGSGTTGSGSGKDLAVA
jgi:hypothetical protein